MTVLARPSSNLPKTNQIQSICRKLTSLFRRKLELQNILASKLIKQILVYITTVHHSPAMILLSLISLLSAVNLKTALTVSHVASYCFAGE
jgi:hypothetical protein